MKGAEGADALAPVSRLVRDDPFVRSLLAQLPGEIGATFSDAQLAALTVALVGRGAGVHRIDLRRSFSFWRWQYYFVVVAGRNRRRLSRREQELRDITLAMLLFAGLGLSTLLGILILYLVKSALGIDLIPGFSLGIWGWFQREFL